MPQKKVPMNPMGQIPKIQDGYHAAILDNENRHISKTIADRKLILSSIPMFSHPRNLMEVKSNTNIRALLSLEMLLTINMHMN